MWVDGIFQTYCSFHLDAQDKPGAPNETQLTLRRERGDLSIYWLS